MSGYYQEGHRLIYLHGFRSSPKSFKAQRLAERMRELGCSASFCCPQLPASPLEAVALVRRALRPEVSDTLVGSSLGGFYATWLAERLGCRAVVINPAVYPARDLRSQVGAQTMYHDDTPFEFLPAHVDELLSLQVSAITFARRYLLVAATGDELLDWREMVAHYRGAKQIVVQGGDHGLSDFEQYVDEVLSFAGLLRA
ncbi:MAG TPA: YqiA/YcfP family alpha/beta fold hydrolase [Burkholderiaceae bacterium]